MPEDTIYLHQAYRSLEGILIEVNDDKQQNTTKNQHSDLFKRIADKIEDNNDTLSAFKQLAELSAVNDIDINLLLINPRYKCNVAELINQLNVDSQALEEFEALELICQHLKEFIELSQLADAAASASQFEKMRHFNHVKTLGLITKLQFSVLLSCVKRFLSQHQVENTKIKTISMGLIDYLNESAIAKIDFYTAAFFKSYYRTDLETLQTSLREDLESFKNALDTYLNTCNFEDKKKQANDIFDGPCSSDQKQNLTEDIFYDASFFTQEEEDEADDIFYDALVEQETKLLACKPKENQNNFKKLIVHFLIEFCRVMIPFWKLDEISLFINSVVRLLEKIKKDSDVKTMPLHSNWKDIPRMPQNLANNHHYNLFKSSKSHQSQAEESRFNNQPFISR